MLKKSGILYNNKAKTKQTFTAGDYIVCLPSGELKVMKREDTKNHVTPASNTDNIVIGDNYIANTGHYSIEFSGKEHVMLQPSVVSRWPVAKIVK